MKFMKDSALVYAGMKIARRSKKSGKAAESTEIFTPEAKEALKNWFVNLEAQLKETK